MNYLIRCKHIRLLYFILIWIAILFPLKTVFKTSLNGIYKLPHIYRPKAYFNIEIWMEDLLMNNNCCMRQTDNGPGPCVLKVEEMAAQNQNFRTAVWTGCHMQIVSRWCRICTCRNLAQYHEPRKMSFKAVIRLRTAKASMGNCASYKGGRWKTWKQLFLQVVI